MICQSPLFCGRFGCPNMGCKSCAACGRVDYCSAECQKADWEVHKKYCKQMTRRLGSFFDCPKQVAAISEQLDTAEDYLSRDPALASQLRISSIFMQHFEILQYRMLAIKHLDEDTGAIVRLCSRFKAILSRVGEAVESGRVCSDKKDYDFFTKLAHLYRGVCAIIRMIYLKCGHLECHLGSFKESIRVTKLIHDDENRTSALTEAYLALYSFHTNTRDLGKAVEVLEEAYQMRSECFGPDDPILQRITLYLCRGLAETGDYERMLEYLRAAIGNIRSSYPEDSEKTFPRCYILYTAATQSFTCAHLLPQGHSERRAVLEEAFRLSAVCMELRLATTTVSSAVEFVTSLVSVKEDIPDDAEIDVIKLLKILLQTYAVYLTRDDDKESLSIIVREMVLLLLHLGMRLERGVSIPSSLDWDTVTCAIGRLKLLARQLLLSSFSSTTICGDTATAGSKKKKSEEENPGDGDRPGRTTTAKLKQAILTAARSGDSDKAAELEKELVLTDLLTFLRLSRPLYVFFNAYHFSTPGEAPRISLAEVASELFRHVSISGRSCLEQCGSFTALFDSDYCSCCCR